MRWMNRYSRFISLINLQWNYTKKLFLLVLVLLGGSEGYFLYSNLSKATFFRKVYDYTTNTLIETEDIWSLRFEEFIARSHWNNLFIASLLVTLLLLISVSFRQKSVAMTEYTYMRLPISTNTWFITTLAHALCVFIILIGVQFLFIFLGYKMYLYFVPREAVMSQGLFLAFVRWDFLRFTFPVTDPLRMIYNGVFILHLSIVATYLNMCITFREKKVGAIVSSIFFYLLFYIKQSIGGSIGIILVLFLSIVWMYKDFSGMKERLGG
jgi:hypothetical protein